MADSSDSEAHNSGTLVLTLDQLQLRPRPLSFDLAFRAAYGELVGAVVAADTPAVLIVAVDPRGEVVARDVMQDQSMLTIGRHERCSFRLPDAHISLRHLVAHCGMGSSGKWSIRLWDLHTDVPFMTEDGAQTTAVSCEGPLFVALDEYALLFIPFSPSVERLPADADDAWDGLSVRRFVDSRAHSLKAPPAPRPVAPPPVRKKQLARPQRDDRDQTLIVHLDAPLPFGHAAAGGEAWVEVGIEFDRVRVSQSFSLEDLKRGILFGRYARCDLTMGQHNEDGRLSRVHLFIVCIDDAIWAIDTASTNGTVRDGVKLGSSMLGGRERLVLAESTRLTWDVRAMGEA